MVDYKMRIAIPTLNNMLCPHFGHCASFTFVDVDEDTRKVIATEQVSAPEHEPGLLPRWVRERGADLVIAGGMGSRAQQLFAQNGVKVIVGAPVGPPAETAKAYIEGTLETGENVCAH